MLRVAATIGSAGALVTGILAAGAGPAGASTLSCGDVLTSSVTLHHDLDCSADTSTPALIIGRPGVTVDLGGHKILGPGGSADTPGVLAGFSHDKVGNGTISDFFAGVAFTPAGSHYLKNVVVRDLKLSGTGAVDTFGVLALGIDHGSISDVTTTGTYAGIVLFASRHSTVSHSWVHGGFYGTVDEEGLGNAISGNKASIYSGGAGVLLGATAHDAVSGNLLGGKGGGGIIDEGSTHLDISGNTVSHLLYGMLLKATTKSVVRHNRGTADGWGLGLDSSDSLDVIGNAFWHGGYGIEADYPVNLLLRSNTTDHNSQIGVYLYAGGAVPPARKNSGAVPTPFSAVVSLNRANFNSIGFYSDFPATGHGNDADHNSLLGCFNVSCIHGMTKLHASIALPAHRTFPVPVLPKRPALKK